METPIIVALIAGWSAIIAGLIDVRSRMNGKLDEKFELVKVEVREIKTDMIDVKADVRELKQDVKCISRKVNEMSE